jgi:hypothetical protein
MERLARLYGKRIVNVNVNIIAAGVLALIVTAVFMHFFVDWNWHEAISRWTTLNSKVVITAMTFIVDLLADLAVYYVLHWYANHAPSRIEKLAHVEKVPDLVDPDFAKPAFTKESLAASPLSPKRIKAAATGKKDTSITRAFVRDATKVQVERMILSPILYVIALGGQHALLHAHVPVAWATAIGFGAGILVTRILHTIFMWREERANARKLATAAGTTTGMNGELGTAKQEGTEPRRHEEAKQ